MNLLLLLLTILPVHPEKTDVESIWIYPTCIAVVINDHTVKIFDKPTFILQEQPLKWYSTSMVFNKHVVTVRDYYGGWYTYTTTTLRQ